MSYFVLNEMVVLFLNRHIARGCREITSSFLAEPDNPRIEFYLSTKKSASTIFAICPESKTFEVYPIVYKQKRIKASIGLRETFRNLGFTIIERQVMVI